MIQVKVQVIIRKAFMFKSFKDMPIWQTAIKIAEKLFDHTDNLPREEDYGFTS